MGINMAPYYPNIFTGRFERTSQDSTFSWFRFIDDIDMKWTHGHDNLEVFFQEANTIHPTMKLTVEVCNNDNVFKDTKSNLVGDVTDSDSTVPSTHSKKDTFEHRTKELTYHLKWDFKQREIANAMSKKLE